MKKYLAFMVCVFLLASPVWAELLTGEQMDTFLDSYTHMLLKAERQAMEQCDTTRIVMPLPHIVTELDANHKATQVAGTIDETLLIEWSGGCTDGKRDGEGVLSWTVKYDDFLLDADWGTGRMMTVKRRVVADTTQRSEGRFVKGQRLGLWCTTGKSSITKDQGQLQAENSWSGCSVLAGHDKPLTQNYRKQPDGSWLEFVAASPTGVTLAAGALEAQSAKVLAAAAAGKSNTNAALVAHSQSLDDLVPGSKIVLAPSAAPLSLKDRRVAIVLSSQTVRELERFKHERQTLIDASAGLSGKAATERAKFIQASDPNRLLINIIKLVKKYAKDAQPADDLTGLQKGSFDYALVVDWKSMTRFDLLGKYGSFPVPPRDIYSRSLENKMEFVVAGESLGGFLIGRDLKAVKQTQAFPKVTMKLPRDYKGADEDYMHLLTMNFARSWGDNAIGYSLITTGLNSMLKGAN